MRNFFNRYYLIKPPDLMLIEWMHGDWPGGMRAPTVDGLRAYSLYSGGQALLCPPSISHTAALCTARSRIFVADHFLQPFQLIRYL